MRHSLAVSTRALLGLLATACLWGTTAAAGEERQGIEFFERNIRPVLVEHCSKCHSAGADVLQGGLQLDTRAGWQTGGDSGPAIAPGRPDESLLIQALRYEGLEMPPDGRLPDNVIADFVRWIERGAPDPRDGGPVRTKEIDWDAARQFWSFEPIVSPPLPAVQDQAWPQTSIDLFVLARLEEQGLRPVAPADRVTLLRRAAFSLTGLPPTPEEIAAFLDDDAPDAFARAVDRLLDSPHYGERWARHWLDVARYAEDQAHTFRPRLYPHGHRYRDWVVRAFNEDMPYDRFIKEQIAADLLDAPDRLEHLPALGFFATGPVYYGDQQMFDQFDDRIDTLTRGFLGLTVACARCHDHKYDPVPTGDYYALAGVIAGSEYVEAPLAPPDVVERHDRAREAAEAQQKRVDAFLKEEAKRLEVAEKDVEKKLPDDAREKLTTMRGELQRLKQDVPPMYPVAHAIKDGANPGELKVLIRGNPKNPGAEAPRRFLRIVAGDDAPPFTQGSGRLELAEAIASPDNPLTPRVLVNRVWQHHFGRGLVGTPSNFGALGERPTHPELLDHLAARFIAGGWSIKRLHREILLSATWQLDTASNSANEAVDPENRLLWRQNRRRLEVEAWRDAMLAVAGSLDRTLGGPSLDLTSDDNRRRTLYAKVSRHELDSLLRLFDFPDPNITAGSRTVTTVPLQQLFVLNSPFMRTQSRRLAARLRDHSADNPERIRFAYRLAFGRPVEDHELERDLAFLQNEEAGDEASRWEQYAQVLLSSNEFMYVD